MKASTRLALLIIVSTALITSCKKSVPKQATHIPKGATFVATINTKSLQKKLADNQATLENILKSFSGSDSSANQGRKEWEELQASGLDLDENFYIAVVQKGGGMGAGKGTTVSSAIGSVKDASKFEAYVKNKMAGEEIRKEKDFSYVSKSGNIIAWSADLAIGMSYQKPSSFSDMQYDSATGSYNFKTPVNADNDFKTELTTWFNLKEEESVASIPEFRDLMQDKSDANMWINSSASIQQMPLPLPKLKELFSNSFTAATMSFEDGKIVTDTKSYYSKELRDLFKEYPGNNADLGLVENYPSDNINGFAVLSFNPDFFNALVKYLEVGGMADAYLTKMMGANYTLQEALKAIKGDMAIVVSDFAMPAPNPNVPGYMGMIPKAQMILNIPVGDKTQMNRLLDKVVQMQMMVKTASGYSLSPALQQRGWQVTADDKNLIIASDNNLLTQYKAKAKKAGFAKDVMNDFGGKAGAMYINIESILNGIPPQQMAEVNTLLPKAKETFKDIRGYSDKFNGKYGEGHFEMRFKNEKANSLTSLLSFIEVTGKTFRHAQSAGMNGLSMPDSTAEALPGE